MSPEEIVERLLPRYSLDAAHEAICALLALSTPPRNPLGFCTRVAQRAEVAEYRYRVRRDGGRRLVYPLSAGAENDVTGDSTLFGIQHPPQLDRVIALEELGRLPVVDVARGMGYFDPAPLDPPTGGRGLASRERTRYREGRARYLKAKKRGRT